MTGATDARELVQSGDKLILGMLDSSICLAVAPVVQSLGGDTIGSVCSSDPLVGPKRAAKNYWSLAITNEVSCGALASSGGEMMASCSRWTRGATMINLAANLF